MTIVLSNDIRTKEDYEALQEGAERYITDHRLMIEALQRLASCEAFCAPTAGVTPEIRARIDFARETLGKIEFHSPSFNNRPKVQQLPEYEDA